MNNVSYEISHAPHIKTEDTTRSIMLDVIIALIFPLVMAIYFFGLRALTLTLTSVAGCIAFEWLYRRVMKKTSTIHDLSAVVTGMLLAFSLPVATPHWLVLIGAFFAIVVVKQLYGGLGKNFLNPALAAHALLLSWEPLITMWTRPLSGVALPLFGKVTKESLEAAGALALATPLSKMKDGILPSVISPSLEYDVAYTLRDTIIGNVPGNIGEVSVIVLLAAMVYLIIRKVITIHIPLSYIATVALLTCIFPLGGNEPMAWMLYSLSSGGLILGAVFMATDYSTSPVSARGQVIYGIGCGVLTVLITYFGAYNEGYVFAILIMNLCVWAIDRYIKPRGYGEKTTVMKVGALRGK